MYIANVVIQNNGGCFSGVFDTLDQVRAFAKANGNPGDLLRIVKNGGKVGDAREIVIA